MKHQSSPRPSRGQRPKRDNVRRPERTGDDPPPLPIDLVRILETNRRLEEEEDLSEIEAWIWGRIQEKLKGAGVRGKHRRGGARRQQAHAREAVATHQDRVVALEEDDPETQRRSPSAICMADLFDEVVHNDLSFIAHLIKYFGVPSSDVADILQEVLSAVCKSRIPYDPLRGKRRTWLYRVAFFRSMAYRGSARHRREKLDGLHPGEALEPVAKGDPEKQAIANEERQIVRESIAKIPVDRRAVFVAYEIEELTMEEIAQALGIPRSTGWTRLQRARVEFRRAVLRRLRVRKALATRRER
jgi:RNA polymerase sigma-70 factor, ECF subfamily